MAHISAAIDGWNPEIEAETTAYPKQAESFLKEQGATLHPALDAHNKNLYGQQTGTEAQPAFKYVAD